MLFKLKTDFIIADAYLSEEILKVFDRRTVTGIYKSAQNEFANSSCDVRFNR